MTASEVPIKGYTESSDGPRGLPEVAKSVSGAVKVDAETALYTELWRACAGLLVTVPREKELVYYFPQCHIEHVFLITFFIQMLYR
ncbi:unnamed protein product [Coffea canephora]|uniref:Uncharacterized protein n=1 Tax=Coffea canephora TaxID=49390 RepID=A0A068V7P6_COFCA|nr:unnamed protein product [Coffea canephora]